MMSCYSKLINFKDVLRSIEMKDETSRGANLYKVVLMLSCLLYCSVAVHEGRSMR